jgi:tetratricopeptide (TPR) repeat protein
MDRAFWSRPDIDDRVKRLTLVRVDFDHNQKLVRRHRVNAIPAVIVLDPWGNPLVRFVGFGNNTQQLELALRVVPDDFAAVEPAMAALEKDDEDFAALRALGEFYHQNKFPIVSAQYYERALESRAAKDDARARGDVLVAVGWSYLQLRNHKQARKDFARALEVPDLERADIALFGLVVADLELGKRGDAEKAFATLAARFPDSQATSEARERLQVPASDGQR